MATTASLGTGRPIRSREQFRQAVLQGQISRKQIQGKTYCEPVPEDELGEVESGYRLRQGAARSCKDLLRAARSALDEAKRSKDPAALRTTAIGICSAYRDYSADTSSWAATFNKQYEKDANRHRMEAMPGGRHGDAALRWFIELMSPIKAPPGFSNHSNGLAVDFSTTESGKVLGADTNQHLEWQRNWFYSWLVSNAQTYRFRPLFSEEWHWNWV